MKPNWSRENLTAALINQAEGSYGAEAAVRLLIEHRSWMTREDFCRFIAAVPSLENDRVIMASVDWQAALDADLPSSTSEAQMLAVAAELAGVDSGRSLQDLLGRLDRANTTLVIKAILHSYQGPGAPPVTVEPFSPVDSRRRDDRPLARERHGTGRADSAEPERSGL